MDGLLRCTRYAFGPNRLHYCGPDANRELLAYIDAGETDPILASMMKKFETLFPYLNLIARANNIKDPFDNRVVEAYWLGNELLDNVNKKSFYSHLADGLNLRKKVKSTELDKITEPIGYGAVPHHSFHVIAVWKRTGQTADIHTLNSIDACRISWGKVIEIDGPYISVKRRPIISTGNKLILGDEQIVKITRSLDVREDIEQLKVGQYVSIHWDVPCEVISEHQKENLKKYTLRHLQWCDAEKIKHK